MYPLSALRWCQARSQVLGLEGTRFGVYYMFETIFTGATKFGGHIPRMPSRGYGPGWCTARISLHCTKITELSIR